MRLLRVPCVSGDNMRQVARIAACAATAWLAFCAPAALAQTDAGEFSSRILPVLQEKFAPLLERETGLVLDSWTTLIAGSEHGEVLIPFDAEGSLLIRLATQLSADDPLRAVADVISDEEIDLVRRWIDNGARNDDGVAPYASATNLLYACNQGAASISVIDMDAQVVIRTVKLRELGFTADARPHHVVAEPDGSFWYVSLIGDDEVLKFNRGNELVGRIAFERPGMLALHTGADMLYVGRSMKAVNPPQRIGLIERATMEIEELDVFFARPHALAIHPAGDKVYVASLAENRMATVDHNDAGVELQAIDGPIHTFVQFAVAPDGQTMVVGGQLTGTLFFFDTTDPAAPVVVDSLKVGAAPWHPVFTPDGSQFWLGNKMAGTATVVDMATRSVAGVVEGLAQPHGAAVSPDGRHVFISNNNLNEAYQPRYDFGGTPGVIAVINTESHAIEKMLEIGPNATGLGTAAR